MQYLQDMSSISQNESRVLNLSEIMISSGKGPE